MVENLVAHVDPKSLATFSKRVPTPQSLPSHPRVELPAHRIAHDGGHRLRLSPVIMRDHVVHATQR